MLPWPREQIEPSARAYHRPDAGTHPCDHPDPPDPAESERAWASYAAAHQPREGEGQLVVGGPVETVAAALAGYVAAGIRHPILIFRSPRDLETIRSLGAIREAVV